MGLQLNCLLLNGHTDKHYKVSCYVEVELSTLLVQLGDHELASGD
jgi:hypothetical protein